MDRRIHLVVTSPPYWTLKGMTARLAQDQLGHYPDYESYHEELRSVWKNCFDHLVPGGRLCVFTGGCRLIWFPVSAEGSEPATSLLTFVCGTRGLPPDEAIMGRPGHARHLRALARYLQVEAAGPDLGKTGSDEPRPGCPRGRPASVFCFEFCVRPIRTIHLRSLRGP